MLKYHDTPRNAQKRENKNLKLLKKKSERNKKHQIWPSFKNNVEIHFKLEMNAKVLCR